jgi:hypothetical protein
MLSRGDSYIACHGGARPEQNTIEAYSDTVRLWTSFTLLHHGAVILNVVTRAVIRVKYSNFHREGVYEQETLELRPA